MSSARRCTAALVALVTLMEGGCGEERVRIPPLAGRQTKLDIALLYRPQRERGKQRSFNLYKENRKIAFLNYAPWPVPQSPSWREDPYRNISWQFLYQSLTWLYIPAFGFESTGDRSYLDQVKHYLLDWINHHPTPNRTMAWYDHSVAYRSATFTYLFHKYFSKSLSSEERSTFMESIVQHGRKLSTLLRDPRYRAHNHSMFHAMALFNLSVAFPGLPSANQWRADSRRRIAELMKEMVVVEEGVSVEQSSSYHWIALSLFYKANALLRNFGSGLDAYYLNVLHGMVDFSALMRWPDGSLPAIGDTKYNASFNTKKSLRNYRKRGYGTGITEFLINGKGTEPRDAYFFPKSGYSIFRPSYARDFTVLVDMGPSRFSHGHHDAMNVLMYAHGARLLIDPGGPYIYHHPLRDFFLHARAHNTVVVNHRDYGPGDVTITRSLDSPIFSFVEGSHRKYRGTLHKRAVFVLKPDLVVILDSLESARDDNLYTLTYHFPPGAKLEATGESDLLLRAGKSSGLRMFVQSSAPSILKVIEGQQQPHLQGWVTTGFGIKVPAPVAQFDQKGKSAWFVTAIQPSASPDQVTLSVTSKREAGGSWDVTVHAPRRVCSIVLPRVGDPRITVKPK